MAKRADEMGRPDAYNQDLVDLVERMFDNWLGVQPKYQASYCPSVHSLEDVGQLLERLASLRPPDLEELVRRYEEAGWQVGGQRSWAAVPNGGKTFAGTIVLIHHEREATLSGDQKLTGGLYDHQNMHPGPEPLPGYLKVEPPRRPLDGDGLSYGS